MAKNPDNKIEQFSWNDLLAPLGLLTVAALVSLAAYSEKQKTALKERDHHSCQFPAEHDCGGELLIHQIIQPKYAKKFGINPDYATNGLTICRQAQQLIYPDIQVPAEEIPAVIKERNVKFNQRQPYWVTVFDRAMNATAVKNTQQAEATGWQFPIKKTRKKQT